MAREGVAKSKRRVSVMKQADQNSNRSKKRSNRGFSSLEKSSRKHRRAIRRSEEKRMISGKLYEPGTKIDPDLKGGKLKVFEANAGGSLKYHTS